MIATTLEQSKKLVELGIDPSTADMCWASTGLGKNWLRSIPPKGHPEEICPAWSLSALLDILNKPVLLDILSKSVYFINEDGSIILSKTEACDVSVTDVVLIEISNPIDACVEMILLLHEQKLL